MVNPSARAYRVQRLLWTQKTNHIESIREWEVAPPSRASAGSIC